MTHTVFQYVVELPPFPTKQQTHWAWWFTVISRAKKRCQMCGNEKRLDASHIQPRKTYPELRFDPDNGQALCRSCHLKYDKAHGHRPKGPPIGRKLSEHTKQKISRANRISHNTPEGKARHRTQALAQWDKIGRKHERRICAFCRRLYKPRGSDAKYCSANCHYSHVKAGQRGAKTGPSKGFKWSEEVIARRAATKRRNAAIRRAATG